MASVTERGKVVLRMYLHVKSAEIMLLGRSFLGMIIHFDATLTKIDRHVADAGLGYLAMEPEIDVLTSKASPIRLPKDSFPRTQVIARGQALLRPWVIKGLLSRLLISKKGEESALQTVISKSI